jgi:hypothetical protein
MTQDNFIGVPFILKIGEMQSSGRLQIKYLGNLTTKNTIRHHLEVMDNGKKYEFKAIAKIKVHGLIIEILEPMAEDDAIKVIVMTKEMFKRKSMQRLNELFGKAYSQNFVSEEITL